MRRERRGVWFYSRAGSRRASVRGVRSLGVAWIATVPSQLEDAGFAALEEEGWWVRRLYVAAPGFQRLDRETGEEVLYGEASDSVEFCGSTLDFASVAVTLRHVWRNRRAVLVVNGYSTVTLAIALVAADILCRGGVVLRADKVDEHPTRGIKRTARRLLVAFHLKCGGFYASTSGAAETYAYRTYGLQPGSMLRMPYLLPAQIIHSGSTSATGNGGSQGIRLFVASKLNGREGAERLLATIEQTVQEVPQLRVVIAGSGDQGHLFRNLAERHANVQFVGWLNYHDYLRQMACADLFLHLPRNEPWGASIGEALALGTAVVASSECIAARELITNTVDGYVVDGDQLEQVVQAIVKTLANQTGHRASRSDRAIRRLNGLTWVSALANVR